MGVAEIDHSTLSNPSAARVRHAGYGEPPPPSPLPPFPNFPPSWDL
jgi:hypothetical protein